MKAEEVYDIDLGLGPLLRAKATLRALPPLPPPETGAEWGEDRDWPRLALEIDLPLGAERVLAKEVVGARARRLAERRARYQAALEGLGVEGSRWPELPEWEGE